MKLNNELSDITTQISNKYTVSLNGKIWEGGYVRNVWDTYKLIEEIMRESGDDMGQVMNIIDVVPDVVYVRVYNSHEMIIYNSVVYLHQYTQGQRVMTETYVVVSDVGEWMEELCV